MDDERYLIAPQPCTWARKPTRPRGIVGNVVIVVGCAQTAAAGGIVGACLLKDSFADSFKRYANAALPLSRNRKWLFWQTHFRTDSRRLWKRVWARMLEMVPVELSDGGPGTFETFDFTFPGLRKGGKRGPEGSPRRVRKESRLLCFSMSAGRFPS